MSPLDSAAGGGWLQLSARVRPPAAEALADLLQSLTGNGVALEPAIAALGPDEGFSVDEAAPAILRAYFPQPLARSERRRIRRLIRAAGMSDAVAGRLSWSAVQDADWSEAWKEHYKVQHVGHIVIRPSWLEYEPLAGEQVIGLDPGMAFGTGEHETTRLCLEDMQTLDLQGAKVLDLGTGSGVLAIAAVALGAAEVTAVDIEDQAVAAARRNVEINGMSDEIRVGAGSLDGVAPATRFDVALVNIHAAAIVDLAGRLLCSVKPGGVLIASGVIAERAAACSTALTAAGFEIEAARVKGDWHSFLCRAPLKD